MEIGRYEMLRFSLYNSYSVLLTYDLTSKMALHKNIEMLKKQSRHKIIIFFGSRKRLSGQGLLIVEAWRSHSETPHSVAVLLTSDQPDAETHIWQNTNSQETNIYVHG